MPEGHTSTLREERNSGVRPSARGRKVILVLPARKGPAQAPVYNRAQSTLCEEYNTHATAYN